MMTFKFDRHHLFKKIETVEHTFKLPVSHWTPVHDFFPLIKMVKYDMVGHIVFFFFLI